MTSFKILPFLPDSPEADFRALNRHVNRMRRERLPDDPPIPLEETIQNRQNVPDYVDQQLWAAWTPGRAEIAGLAGAAFLRTEENRHVGQFELTVVPEHRLQGLGRQLLRLVAEAARQDNRRLLVASTTDRVPGGEAFMLRLGAHKGLVGHTNQLRLDELDRDLLRAWLERSPADLEQFELGFWDGPYPEDQIQAIADLNDLVNQQPLGDLEIEDMHLTPQQIRQMEKNIFARGYERWTFYLLDRTTGQFAGYTETTWNPNRPELLGQEMTGVFSQYRGRGLGRWLKAAMLEKVLRERPQVRFVRTGNADSNAAMLKINTEMGFKPYMAQALWQVETQQVFDYLASRPEAAGAQNA